MKFTDFTRSALAVRRDARGRKHGGWLQVNENGGPLWRLQRGDLWHCRITDVAIAADGKSLWVKVGET